MKAETEGATTVILREIMVAGGMERGRALDHLRGKPILEWQ